MSSLIWWSFLQFNRLFKGKDIRERKKDTSHKRTTKFVCFLLSFLIHIYLPSDKFNWRAFSKLTRKFLSLATSHQVSPFTSASKPAYAWQRTCVSFRSRLCASNRYRRGLPVHAPSRFSRIGMSYRDALAYAASLGPRSQPGEPPEVFGRVINGVEERQEKGNGSTISIREGR